MERAQHERDSALAKCEETTAKLAHVERAMKDVLETRHELLVQVRVAEAM